MLTLARHAMRTRFELVLADEDRDAADLRAAGEEALDEITRAESLLSIYRADAVLYTVNAHAADGPVAVDGETFAFLRRCAELSAGTGGAFDPTVRPLVDLWAGASAEDRLPTDAEIDDRLALVGMTRVVHLDEEAQTVAFAVPGVRLDPGAVGKGWALDRARDLLRAAGVRRALLHGGTSSICTLGTPPAGGEAGWRIGVQHPLRPEDLLTDLPLNDGEALGASALHGKTFYAAGRRFGHLLDPRTGRPVEHTLLAAVVTPDSATDADALSTALLVAGAEGIPSFPSHALRSGLNNFLTFTDEKGQ